MSPPDGRGLCFVSMPPPAPGALVAMAPGVFWLRMPLPMALDHINLWVLEDTDGWVLVDTGMGTPETYGLWERLFADGLAGKPVRRVLVTHMHPDHVGAAGWLVRRWGVELVMTREEFLQCRNLVADTDRAAPDEALNFYRSAGWNEDQLEQYRRRFGSFGKVVSPLPSAYARMRDGELLSINERSWQVRVGSGHSPEHACLFCPELNLVISGDQILPTISSNVSVWPTEPSADPLADWLKSCVDFRDALPADVLVLPSHGLPFTGVVNRLNRLIEMHEDALDRVINACDEPRSAADIMGVLFRRRLEGDHLYMATGEALAHLHYLFYQGVLDAEIRAGCRYFQRSTG
jgi:glyoxylase-like metal-dependent hydrolase (beta-lactamase superfamily II)